VVYYPHPAFNAEDNRLQRSVTLQLNEWRNDPLNAKINSRHLDDQSQLKMAKRLMRVPTCVTSPGQTRGIALSNSEETEVLADSLEAQFQAVNDPT
jgi:hypothetical protein